MDFIEAKLELPLNGGHVFDWLVVVVFVVVVVVVFETGLNVGSARRFGGSIGTLITTDADVARKPAEVNVKARCFE